MKKFLFLFLLFLSFAPFSDVLEDENKAPAQELKAVLKFFNLPSNSWEEIIKATQEKWIRESGKERWEIEADIAPTPGIYSLFTDLKMTSSFHSENTCYRYALILGSTVEKVRGRFTTLKKEWDKGLRVDSIVVLTGDRPLNPDFEEEKHLLDPRYSSYPFKKGWHFEGELPKNETEMTKLVFDQLDLPKEWEEKIVYIDTPKKNGKRPNTQDTFLFWLATNPAPGPTLVISDQPFLLRADILARQLLPCFEIESIGEGFTYEQFREIKNSVSILQDELARAIFTLKMCNGAS